MKYLLIILLICGGYYYFQSNSDEDSSMADYLDVMKNFDKNGASLDEVKSGANSMALFFCNDETFQLTGGQTVASCIEKYNESKYLCEYEVFHSAPKKFVDRKEVSSLVKKFGKCVGIK
jgi:hypothetical protein